MDGRTAPEHMLTRQPPERPAKPRFTWTRWAMIGLVAAASLTALGVVGATWKGHRAMDQSIDDAVAASGLLSVESEHADNAARLARLEAARCLQVLFDLAERGNADANYHLQKLAGMIEPSALQATDFMADLRARLNGDASDAKIMSWIRRRLRRD